MRMTTEEFFGKSTMDYLNRVYGRRKAHEAVDRMKCIIEHARQAEAEGRIIDMFPSIGPNNGDDIRAGKLTLDIVYRKPGDAVRMERRRYTSIIFQGETHDDRSTSEKEGATV
jgi:hypothetical protein